MKLSKPLRIILIVLCVWLALGVCDIAAVMTWNKPIFSFCFMSMDDGGSGMYIGPGWAFDIRGSFMPEETPKGVTQYDYYLFGIKLFGAKRDV